MNQNFINLLRKDPEYDQLYREYEFFGKPELRIALKIRKGEIVDKVIENIKRKAKGKKRG